MLSVHHIAVLTGTGISSVIGPTCDVGGLTAEDQFGSIAHHTQQILLVHLTSTCPTVCFRDVDTWRDRGGTAANNINKTRDWSTSTVQLALQLSASHSTCYSGNLILPAPA
jgi:hypothetical protein